MPASAASKAATHFLQFRIQYSSIALLYYDYALTFPSEVKHIWGQRFRFSTSLYIFCRYALIANVLYVLAVTGKFHSGCDAVYILDGALSVLGRGGVIAAMTGRTYAVFGCSRIVLAVLVVLGAACMVLDIMHVPGLKCVGSSSNRITSDTLAILMRVCELVAAVLTTVRSLLEFRVGKTWKFERRGFMIVIFKQGVIYILFSTAFSIAAVLLQFRAPSGSLFTRLLNSLSLPLSCLLTARFLLQLREWQAREAVMSIRDMEGSYTQQAQTLSALRVVEGFDAAMLEDFGNGAGDYAASLNSNWGSETLQSDGDHGEMEMREQTSNHSP